MRGIRSDTVIAVVLLCACGVFFNDTFSFRQAPLATVAPELWPRVVLAFLFLFSAVYFVRSLRARASEREPGARGPRAWVHANRNVLWGFGLFALFLLALPLLGMLIAGGLFVFAVLTAMGRNDRRSHVTNAAIAAVSIGVMWAVFTFGLHVMLPAGEILPVF